LRFRVYLLVNHALVNIQQMPDCADTSMDTLLSAVANNQLGYAEKLPIAVPLHPRALYTRTRDTGPRRAHALRPAAQQNPARLPA